MFLWLCNIKDSMSNENFVSLININFVLWEKINRLVTYAATEDL